MEGLTNGISALNAVRRPLPTYGSWAGAVAPPLHVSGGPGRLSEGSNATLQVLCRADPIRPLTRHASALFELGVNDFVSLSVLKIFDLQEAGIPREDGLRIAFARRHFDAAHTRPRGSQLLTGVNMLACHDASDTMLGESTNETLASLHHLG